MESSSFYSSYLAYSRFDTVIILLKDNSNIPRDLRNWIIASVTS